MKKNSTRTETDWSQEIINAMKLAGKVILRVLGYIINVLLTLLLIGMITGTVVGGAFVIYVTNYVDASIDGLDLLTAEKSTTTKICYMDFSDRTLEEGKIIELEDQRLYGAENQIWVPYDQIPKNLINAFVSYEDKRFFQHQGVDWITTTKKAFDYFTGNMSGGASTITQQLIKNLTGDDDVSIQRKAQEIIRALNLEKQLDKTEILELYLNHIYLAQRCNGVGAAAHTYFNKDVSELNLLECAAIAGITQNPSKYDPIRNPENNKKRRDTVLEAMYNNGCISKQEYEENVGKDLVLYQPDSDSKENAAKIYSWYTDAAIEESITLLMDYYNVSKVTAESMIYSNGLQIVTAQDPEIQEYLEQYYLEEYHFTRMDDSFLQPECSCVVIDPETGDVLGLVGRRGEKPGNRVLNFATSTKRPPGSSIKPISVYAPALEKGLITYGTVIDDSPVNFGEYVYDASTGGMTYNRPDGYPNNAPAVYEGLTTIHKGIRVSKNTVAYKVLEMLTPEASYQFLTQKLGITTLIENEETSDGRVITDISYAPLALGQISNGLTVKELTAAYSIFANKGVYNKPRIVLKILDSNGKELINNERDSHVVISEQNACIMTKMLEEVVDFGTAKNLTVKEKIDCAGKTGTTTMDNDRWFVGYTPYYICGVWFGYEMPQSLAEFSATYSPALLVWDDIMNTLTDRAVAKEAQNGGTIKTFQMAAGVVTATYCADSGKLVTEACKHDPRGSRAEVGYFTQDTVPTEECDVHVLVNYDKVGGGIATEYCPEEYVIKVGLLNYKRSFVHQVNLTDAQYICWNLPDGILPGGDESQPYFINAIPDKVFVGISPTEVQYNHVCTAHGPHDEPDEDKEE